MLHNSIKLFSTYFLFYILKPQPYLKPQFQLDYHFQSNNNNVFHRHQIAYTKKEIRIYGLALIISSYFVKSICFV